MPTGLEYLTRAMQDLGILEAGATPSASEQAMGLIELNSLIGQFQAMNVYGWTQTATVNTAGVWTITTTPTAVPTFALISTNNSYPSGWDDAIRANLAVRIAGPFGAPADVIARVAAQATAYLEAIKPKVKPVASGENS